MNKKFFVTWINEKTKEEGAFGQIFTNLERAWVWADAFNGRDDGKVYGVLEGVKVEREQEQENV